MSNTPLILSLFDRSGATGFARAMFATLSPKVQP